MSNEEKSCKGCKYHTRCADGVFSVLGAITYPVPQIENGNILKEWCHNWQEMENENKEHKEKKEE